MNSGANHNLKPERNTYAMKRMVALLCGILVLTIMQFAFAVQETYNLDDNIIVPQTGSPASDFRYATKNGECIIRGYIGTNTFASIPEYIDDCVVTTINDNAFKDNDVIEIVRLPKTIRNIGENAFRSCKNLKLVLFPKEQIDELTIEDGAFCSSFVGENLIINAKRLTIIGLAFYSSCGRNIVFLSNDITFDSYGESISNASKHEMKMMYISPEATITVKETYPSSRGYIVSNHIESLYAPDDFGNFIANSNITNSCPAITIYTHENSPTVAQAEDMFIPVNTKDYTHNAEGILDSLINRGFVIEGYSKSTPTPIPATPTPDPNITATPEPTASPSPTPMVKMTKEEEDIAKEVDYISDRAFDYSAETKEYILSFTFKDENKAYIANGVPCLVNITITDKTGKTIYSKQHKVTSKDFSPSGSGKDKKAVAKIKIKESSLNSSKTKYGNVKFSVENDYFSFGDTVIETNSLKGVSVELPNIRTGIWKTNKADYLYICPCFKNSSSNKATIDAIDFEMRFYDAYGKIIKIDNQYDYGGYVWDRKIRAGQTFSQTNSSNYGYRVEVGYYQCRKIVFLITKLHTTDGQTITLTEDERLECVFAITH